MNERNRFQMQRKPYKDLKKPLHHSIPYTGCSLPFYSVYMNVKSCYKVSKIRSDLQN